MDSLETAYHALLDERCPSCRQNIEPSHARLAHDKNKTYSTVYTCPHCNSATEYTITIQQQTALVSVRKKDDDLISEKPKLLTRLAEHGQDAKQQFDYSHHLDVSLNIVYQNLNRMFTWGERFPEIFEQTSGTQFSDLDDRFDNELIVCLGRDKRWIGLHTDIHNYLSSIYSHHQFVEDTISTIMEADTDVDRLQTQYNATTKPLLGLRHYTQHRMIIPLHVRSNTGSADRAIDLLVNLDDVRDYEYRDGFDHWFNDIDGNYIDIISQGIQHYRDAAQHAIERIKTGRKNHAQSLQEIEELQEKYPTLDDIDVFTNFDNM